MVTCTWHTVTIIPPTPFSGTRTGGSIQDHLLAERLGIAGRLVFPIFIHNPQIKPYEFEQKEFPA
jgi:hypothetical protein